MNNNGVDSEDSDDDDKHKFLERIYIFKLNMQQLRIAFILKKRLRMFMILVNTTHNYDAS